MGNFKLEFRYRKWIIEDTTSKLLQIITVDSGYRYQKQLMEWSGTAKQKKLVLLSETRDGTKVHFHSKCDRKGKTWTIIEGLNGNVFRGKTSTS